MKTQKTFVLVHGAWHGGWCWAQVADLLRDQGHKVFTPTQTGLGERSHLISKEITLNTFIDDVANLILWENLEDVILVGHSFGGNTISGVADRMPQKIKKLIYLDAMIIHAGETPLSTLSKEIAENRIQAAQDSSNGLSLPIPPAKAMGIFEEDQIALIDGKLTPHPFSTFLSPLEIKNPPGNSLPLVYVLCTNPMYKPLEDSRANARKMGWPMVEMDTGHDAPISAPQKLAELLDQESY